MRITSAGYQLPTGALLDSILSRHGSDGVFLLINPCHQSMMKVVTEGAHCKPNVVYSRLMSKDHIGVYKHLLDTFELVETIERLAVPVFNDVENS